jgi:hypothetical protein
MAEVASSSPADIMFAALSSPVLSSPVLEVFPDFDPAIAVMTDVRASPLPNKLVGQLARENISRTPSPRSTHFSVPYNGNGNGHRILRSATVGYVAPEFKGKKEQMLQGEYPMVPAFILS